MTPRSATARERFLTVDRGPPGGGPPLSGSHSEPLTVGEIGPNRSILPDGSLLCRNVPIARTGWMQYAPGEVPLPAPKQPGAAPIIYVHRGPEDLFNDDTMRSFVGVAVTLDHPPVPVTPQNFAHIGKGFVLRTFRGDGPDSDCLMADLIIKDRWTIDHYRLDTEGPVSCEVSCGYEATYLQTGDGQGRQTNIIGNHLALVDRGRCGPRCAIGDEDTLSSTVNEELMTTPNAKPGGARPRTPLVEARAAVADAIANLQAAEEGEASTQGVHVHVHMGATEAGASTASPQEPAANTPPQAATMDAATDTRFKNLETDVGEMKGTLATILAAVTAGGKASSSATNDADPEAITEATATMDSAALATSYQQFLSQAEILVPGFKLPTFDGAMQRKLTVDRMCAGRRAVLSAVVAQKEGSALLASVNGGKEFDVIGSDCAQVAVAFKAASAAKATQNNRQSTGDANALPQNQQQAQPQKRQSFADINAANKAFWASQGPRA